MQRRAVMFIKCFFGCHTSGKRLAHGVNHTYCQIWIPYCINCKQVLTELPKELQYL